MIKNKRGVSIIIGYVLLISFVLVISVVVYQWMKTYVPRDDIDCPDGVSLFVEDYSCSTTQLNITLKNNGKFNIGGFFIYLTDSPDQKLATIDISQNITLGGDKMAPSGVKIYGADNSMRPNVAEQFQFNLSGTFYSMEILPIRWDEINKRKRLVVCQNAKIREDLNCN